ncbi:MAG: hypothetical protein HQL87_11810 [Magnetococcales bacterium]|nr:hypothetical protein [Magnetococcales bacterium]
MPCLVANAARDAMATTALVQMVTTATGTRAVSSWRGAVTMGDWSGWAVGSGGACR